jgi:hypothetical protein
VSTPQEPELPDSQLPALLAATGLVLVAKGLSELPAVKGAVTRREQEPRQKASADRVVPKKRYPQKPQPAQAPRLRVQRPVAKTKQRPVTAPRRRQVVRPAAPQAVPKPVRRDPQEIGEVIALRVARTTRQTAIGFLESLSLTEELEHLLALEERLTVGSKPAMFHAALSTRLLLSGVANLCFPPKDGHFEDRFGRRHEVKQENVKNRLAAFVDVRLRSGLSDEEHRLFVSTLDTVSRWCGRGPHRIYHPLEAQQFFLRLLDVLSTVSRAYYRPQP